MLYWQQNLYSLFSLSSFFSLPDHSQKVKNQELTKCLGISQYHITALTSGARRNSSKWNTHTPTQRSKNSFIFPTTDTNKEIWEEKLEGSHLFE